MIGDWLLPCAPEGCPQGQVAAGACEHSSSDGPAL
jgi:hypothetical protein